MSRGKISAVLDTQAVTCMKDPRMVHLNGDYLGVAGYNTANDGYLRTYTVGVDGDISNSEIDSWNYSSYAQGPDIIKIPGSTDKYLLGYEPLSGAPGVVNSLTISITGVITESFVDSLTITNRMVYGKLFHTGDANDICLSNCSYGKLNSYTVDDAGNIGASVLDTQDYSDPYIVPGNITSVDGNYYATIYQDNLYTFSIDGSGNITAVDTWDFTEATGLYSIIMKKVPNSTTYMIASRDADTHGEIITFSISNTGVITKSVIDTLDFESGACGGIGNIIHAGDDYFTISGRSGSDGKVYTFTCDAAGELSNTIIDSATFYDGTAAVMGASHMQLIHQGGMSGVDTYAVIYNISATENGELTTFTIGSPWRNPGGDINPYKTRISS